MENIEIILKQLSVQLEYIQLAQNKSNAEIVDRVQRLELRADANHNTIGNKIPDELQTDTTVISKPALVAMTLELADAISSSIVNLCKSRKFSPVTVVVLNAQGQQILSKMMDGCVPVGYPQFAFAKANTAVVTKGSSRAFSEKYTNPSTTTTAKQCQLIAMTHLADGKLAPFAGGVLLLNKSDNSVIGAVGVSGSMSDEDEFMALIAIHENTNPDLVYTDPLLPVAAFR